MIAQKRGSEEDRPHGSEQPGGDGLSVRSGDTEFLEKLAWALDGLRRHSQQRGHAGLAEKLARAHEAAREELEAAQPRPAEIASGRMRALWRHEGRR